MTPAELTTGVNQMTVNTLVHTVSVVERYSVETVGQLREALENLAECDSDCLEKTYVVEMLSEQLSDGSFNYSINIRPAERT